MDVLSNIGVWISQNEALLSGLAAMIVVAGVVFTPFGAGLRRVLDRGNRRAPESREFPPTSVSPPEAAASSASLPETESRTSEVPSDLPSIAVLPLSNMSDDAAQQHMADGMAEDIITGLAANRHLYVVSRNSSFAYRGQSPDIRVVGRDLGVRYVLEGSLRKVGDLFRTTVQLIQASDGNHIWAHRYDTPSVDMPEAQDEVVRNIELALAMNINKAERKRTQGKSPEALGAWALVQQGVAYTAYGSPGVANGRKSVEALKTAVELYPDDGFAHACYAWMLYSSAINGWTHEPMQAFHDGLGHLNLALETDIADPLTQYYLGCAYVYSGNSERAIRFLESSLNENPHQADALVHLALAMAFCNRFDESYALFDRADRAEVGATSMMFRWYRGIVLCLDERFEEAIAIIEPIVDQIPRYATARVTLAIAYEGIGQSERAQAEIVRAAEYDPDLHLDGIALNLSAHHDPEKGNAREAILRRYWPAS